MRSRAKATRKRLTYTLLVSVKRAVQSQLQEKYLVLINVNIDSSLINKGVIRPKHPGKTRPNNGILAIEPELAAGLGHPGEQYLS